MAMIALIAGAAASAIGTGVSVANSVTTAQNNNPTNQVQAAVKGNLDYSYALDQQLIKAGMPAGIPYLQGAQNPGYRAVKGTNYAYSHYQGLSQTQDPNFTSPLAFAQGLDSFSKYNLEPAQEAAEISTAL